MGEDFILALLSQADSVVSVMLGCKWLILLEILFDESRQRLFQGGAI